MGGQGFWRGHDVLGVGLVLVIFVVEVFLVHVFTFHRHHTLLLPSDIQIHTPYVITYPSQKRL